MRHIHGVFTQRLNRAKNTDGQIFCGRYKAIIVDSDAYHLRRSLKPYARKPARQVFMGECSVPTY